MLESQLDALKGRFGGAATANGRRISALIRRSADPEQFEITITVRGHGWLAPHVRGDVEFFLPERFFEQGRRIVPAIDGRATLRLLAWGVFTLGARCDGGRTSLELDLREVPGAPAEFLKR